MPPMTASPVPQSSHRPRHAERPRAVRGEFACTLALRHAGARRVAIRWEALGDDDASVVLVAGGISADRHVAASTEFPQAGWWDAQVGAGRALDPRKLRVLACDWIGADGTLDVPIDPADQADALAALLDALGIATLEAFVGASYGAMAGLQFAALHPRRLRRLCAISGSHRAHPYASAWRALQRQAVALGALQCDEPDGLALARQLAMLAYRTPEEFEQRFGPAEVVAGRVRVGAEDYLRHCAATYVARTAPTGFVRLSESIDLQRLDPAAVHVPTTIVAVAEDRLVPLADAWALADGLRGPTRVRVLRSRYGHDAFLKEHEAIAAVLADFLAGDAGACARERAA
jgi:homoserine O-acetyltransferase